MRAVYYFGKLTVLAICAGFTIAVVSLAFAAEPRDNARAKAEADRKMADFQRKMDEAKRNQKAIQERLHQPSLPDAPPFDPTGAPTPEECLRAFIVAARQAQSMDEIIDYVPHVQQKAIRYRQSTYDPKLAAAASERLRAQHPEGSASSLSHVQKSPSEFFLKWYKDVAESIIDIKSVKIDGNKAKLVVLIHRNAVVNGEQYSYSDADVEMVGEGTYWKLLKYKPDIVVYKQAP